jgi:Flp pilus assembly protein TadG
MIPAELGILVRCTVMANESTFAFLRRRLCALRTADAGNVVITFTLALLPIMGAVGAAVDYSVANKARTELQAAADAAAVGSVAKSSAAMKAAISISP